MFKAKLIIFIFLIILLTSLFGISTMFAVGENLAPNSDFELSPYQYYETLGSATFTWATDASHSSSHSLKNVSNVASQTMWLNKITAIPAQAGLTYTCTAWYKSLNLESSADLRLTFWSSSQAYLGGFNSSPISGTNDWTQLTISAEAPANTAYIKIIFSNNGRGTLWVDDVYLKVVQNLAPNPKFETDPYVDYETLGSATFTWATDASHSSSHSLKNVSNVASQTMWLNKITAIPAQAGLTYTCTAWYKSQNLESTADLRLTFWSSSQAYLGGFNSSPISGTNDWTQLAISAEAPANTAYIKIIFSNNGKGTLWVDDVVLSDGSSSGATLLFKSGFEGNVALTPVGSGVWEYTITGLDTSTGYTWPMNWWDPKANPINVLQTIVPDYLNLTSYVEDRIETVIGHNGTSTKALFQSIKPNDRGSPIQNPLKYQNQDALTLVKGTSDLTDYYTTWWMKYGEDVVSMDRWDYRILFEYKTWGYGRFSTPDPENERLSFGLYNTTGQTKWHAELDNCPGGSDYWVEESSVNLPVANEWFKVEIYWHRSKGSDGRFYVAINGTPVINRHGYTQYSTTTEKIGFTLGPTIYGDPVSREGGTQWIDDYEIWSTFPGAIPP